MSTEERDKFPPPHGASHPAKTSGRDEGYHIWGRRLLCITATLTADWLLRVMIDKNDCHRAITEEPGAPAPVTKPAIAAAILAPPCTDGSIGLAKSSSVSQIRRRSIKEKLRRNASRVMQSLSSVSADAAMRRRSGSGNRGS